MPPKPLPGTDAKQKVDELIEALTNPRVIEAFIKALGPVLVLTVDEALNKRLVPFRLPLVSSSGKRHHSANVTNDFKDI